MERILTVTNSQKIIKHKKTALYVLLIYILMQLSGTWLVKPFHKLVMSTTGLPSEQAALITPGWYIALSFAIALIVSLIITSRDKTFWDIYQGKKETIPLSIMWGIIGFFLVFFGQMIGAAIEMAIFGIQGGSQNTADIVNIAKGAPIAIFAIVVFGPILEEFVFRRVIFGSLVQTTNFWVAAIVSAIFFALIHNDFTHILLYTICGLIFAFLYHKTKRIWTSIIAHVMLNGFVTLVQVYAEPIQKFLQELEKMQ
ncbi:MULTISPECIES: CPBP family intramembrane glutamic endopeptidase [unclassified Lysinibacillus]|uniref:CPBP family intramembrane glutamic endopeptidase n=1 Tax=unclassified Lysinibacillus TaxID=2636778 RepID=UPI0020121397|nr:MULTISPECIES: CPBP family intramembrane glutamic endopeptidase [unclassified Lysinibacillus]MCL1698263.1 CPBP family intramembrane metalloprotease [Lysinibacillus sp. BPa_S21]MCL1703278.1 CPBP family intramembrane metalloprotease [Lysinibacillus sp. Bpr_S20]